MKIGFSLETVNMRYSGPNAERRLTAQYWTELLKLVAAAGFDAVEMPYNPYLSDPMSCIMNRNGAPVSRFSIVSRFGSVRFFVGLLRGFGIKEVTGVHISADDTLRDIFAWGGDPETFYEGFLTLAQEAMEFLGNVGGKGLVISPTPEIGSLMRWKGDGEWEEDFLSRMADVINTIGEKAAAAGLQTAVRNEFWSVVRGKKVTAFLKRLDAKLVSYSPDLAHLTIARADPVAMINRHRNRLKFVRFNDTSFRDTVGNYKKEGAELPVTGSQTLFRDMGDGDVDIQTAYRALKNAGYDGWIICESKNTADVYKGILKLRWFIKNNMTA